LVTNSRPIDSSPFGVLAVTQGQWGERIADHVGRFHPPSWAVHRWAAPRALPLVVDDPADFLPPKLPRVDLVLALGETAAVAQLVPDIVKVTGAKAVIAPIDRNESLPPGLAVQLQGWLADLGVAVALPKPFCSLTESTYNQPPVVVKYDNPIIRRFAEQFGTPRFRITVDGDRRIAAVEVERDSACGCAAFVAQGLVGRSVEEAEYQAGMLHHHYPCLASMNQDAHYNDTLMHVSGHILREAISKQIKEHLEPTPYLRPMGRVESET
jgi:thymidylate synthase